VSAPLPNQNLVLGSYDYQRNQVYGIAASNGDTWIYRYKSTASPTVDFVTHITLAKCSSGCGLGHLTVPSVFDSDHNRYFTVRYSPETSYLVVVDFTNMTSAFFIDAKYFFIYGMEYNPKDGNLYAFVKADDIYTQKESYLVIVNPDSGDFKQLSQVTPSIPSSYGPWVSFDFLNQQCLCLYAVYSPDDSTATLYIDTYNITGGNIISHIQVNQVMKNSIWGFSVMKYY